ncbi:glutathione S-transferase T3-like [Chenopodium quinoa]|uniref:glutathione S-transferase T3-like n=1 Tax=Chenopodium quinoa TaxID=63459 RepID=UPI000B78E442|nr:glutathione S-transferase T3-like [Chenopodium quinoa]
MGIGESQAYSQHYLSSSELPYHCIRPATPEGERSSNLTPPDDPRVPQQANDDADGVGDDDVVQGPHESNTNVREEKSGAKEDDALVSAWVECAVEDPETATDQSLAVMWRNIKSLYDQAREENPSTMRPRTLRSIKSRWERINKDVSIWVGCYSEAKKRYRSGTNTHDEMTETHEIYRGTCNGSRFGLIGCWEMLRELDKWKPMDLDLPSSDGGNSKRSEPDTPTDEGPKTHTRRRRPDGVKASKRKGKSVVNSGIQIGGSSEIKNLESFTQALSEMNVMKGQHKDVDERQIDVAERMLEYQKERDAIKARKKQEEKRFKLFSVLLAKPILSEEEKEIYLKLKQEFAHLLG